MVGMAAHHPLQLGQAFPLRTRLAFQQIHGVAYGSQRIAKLMSQRCEERVFASIGLSREIVQPAIFTSSDPQGFTNDDSDNTDRQAHDEGNFAGFGETKPPTRSVKEQAAEKDSASYG